MDVKELLTKVKSGACSVEEAEHLLRQAPFEEMDFAKLDTHRKIRSGFPEVIYCEGKPDDFLVSIYKKMRETQGEAFGTRASRKQYELVKEVVPKITYDEVSRILKYEKPDMK